MSQKAVRIHGGSMTLGADAEQKNFEIEELISDPVDAVKSRMQYNTSSIRIKYSESLGVLRSIAHTDDIATVNTAINNEVINRNSAISTAINNEVVNRNNAIAATSSGINTGDETAATIRSKLGISTLSGVIFI